MEYVIIGVILLILILIIANFKIVPQAQVYVVERLGAFNKELHTGPHLIIPFIDRVVKKVSIKEQVADFKPQPVITKDNVTMQIDTVVFFQITNAKLYTYGVERPMAAIENLTATTLRNIIGEMELDATLTSRDNVNSKITMILDEATDRWGIKVNRVELKNILPPREIQDAMEKQMKAERERREKILQAEGEKKAQILVAEGEKESKILKAQADKEAEILKAEADRQAEVLRAEGEAMAIEAVQTALAESIKKLNEASPSEQVIALKSLEAFQKAADGKATKIIIPSEIQSLAGLATSLKALTDGESN
ncbi:MAG: SPFH/Band 7/PHB domain protein [Oscillospiraceae bacterium]|nr:SPFH/Band 7/PHB domain protein [Oscillospiraceae bacterium]